MTEFTPKFLERAHQADTRRPAPMVEDLSPYAPVKPDSRMLTELHDILTDRLNQPPLQFIAEALVKLPYIDMVNLAEGVKADPRAIFDWAKSFLKREAL
jgi:hypothetical protein